MPTTYSGRRWKETPDTHQFTDTLSFLMVFRLHYRVTESWRFEAYTRESILPHSLCDVPKFSLAPSCCDKSHQRLKVMGPAERLHASSWKDKILNPMTLWTLAHWLQGLELHCVDLGREEWRRRPTASQKTAANMAAWPSHTLQTSWPGRALAHAPGLAVWWPRHRSRFNFAVACRNAAGYLFWGAQLSTPIPQSPTSDTAND